ncbi:MAG: Na+/H+ antiporter subunit E [Chloroflexota bacterium]
MSTVLLLAFPVSVFFMAVSGQTDWQGFVFGYVISAITLRIGQAQNLNIKLRQAPRQVLFLLLYSLQLAWDIFYSSVQVVRIVFTPDIDKAIDPGVLKITTQDPTNNEIVTAISSHGITITPGQLVLDITEENGETVMHVHNLNVEASRPTIEQDQERRLQIIKRILGYDG